MFYIEIPSVLCMSSQALACQYSSRDKLIQIGESNISKKCQGKKHV